MIVAGIVVAAGKGERFGGAKHLRELGGKPLWVRARDALLEGGVAQVVVVGDVPGGIAGGARRRDSTAAGLDHLPAEASLVLVHDAARPLAAPELVRRVIDRLRDGGVDAVVPAVPVRDTIKRVSGGRVVETLDRSTLVAVQTPQGFTFDALRRAHAASDDDAPDDAVLVERNGGTVVTVPGDPINLKVTYPQDLAVAEALL